MNGLLFLLFLLLVFFYFLFPATVQSTAGIFFNEIWPYLFHLTILSDFYVPKQTTLTA